LLLRHDNADLRLSEIGFRLGLIDRSQYAQVESRRERLAAARRRLAGERVHPRQNATLVAAGFPAVASATPADEYLRRPEARAGALAAAGLAPLPDDLAERVEIEVKYAGYIERQAAEARRLRALEHHSLPTDLDYERIGGLRAEARQRLLQFRPTTVGQASRIFGVTPADVAVLLVRVRGRR
jgi:tRNA uridine 5-carboxymethylaminomethyl modification enzyme